MLFDNKWLKELIVYTVTVTSLRGNDQLGANTGANALAVLNVYNVSSQTDV